ncbi:MAG TPA: outer membrane channel protein TolC [Alteromonas sp.]|uniref:outer membrane channel protein TolC n=1 Tax=Marisediminitalea aggregata TaxID=634436 RepID=UPI000E9491C9|nr:outer membrane channel protein TolC [Marisediminitalea aggregata]MCP4524744.1 outer membrane channel protein TolC [Aestuariibacter sp.]MCP9477388.1 outer membrane channel protein TolC [Marisediminitalea aggregata]HBY41117.1 outer membrane channel protein TolC [Alteromonas sp.]|tara:strand:+ start:14758 stop:16128 length:1371 start_codon:yes stop_codon:yes gene_type:complete
MKKTLISLMLGFGMTTPVLADSLLEVYQQALANDPVVNRAKAQRDAAYQGIPLSRAALLPQVSGSLGYSKSSRETTQTIQVDNDDGSTGFNIVNVDIDSNSTSYGIDLNMSLYDHSNWLGLDRAELTAEQSDATYAAATQELIVRTVTAYLNVLRAQDNLNFVQAEKRAIERQLEQTKQRFEVGLTAITDVHEAQANYDSTVAQEIVAENQIEMAREALRVITGKYHDRLYVLNTERFTATAPTPERVDGWLSIAENANLTLLAQRLALDVAKMDIDIATAGHYPTVGLSASYGASKGTTESPFFRNSTPFFDSQSIGVSVNVPIYQGGSVSAQADRARDLYVSSSQDLELAYRQTVQSVRSSFNDVKASISTIRALEQAVVSAESALKATEAGFDVGTRTIVDVLNSTRNLFNARANLSGARYDFIQAMVTLKQAAGNLKAEDIELLEQGMKAAD